MIGQIADFQGEPNYWIAPSSQEGGIVFFETEEEYGLSAYSFESELFAGLTRFLEATQSSFDGVQEIAPDKLTNDSISFEHQGGVIINYSYFPRWKSRNRGQTVFKATPSVMYVVSTGKTELYFD